jgi:hypothetical protein
MKTRLPDDVLKYFQRQGSRGGTIGSNLLTAAQRKARAVKASRAAAVARTKKALRKKV